MAVVMSTDGFETKILPSLRALLRRIRFYVFAEGLAYTSVAALLCFLSQISIDYLFRLRVDLRAALLVTLISILGVIVWRTLVKPLRTAIDTVDAAAVLERKFPHLQSRLISAVQFARGEVGAAEFNSPALISRVIEQASQITRNLPTHEVLNHKRARLHSAVVCSVLAVLVVFTLLAPQAMATWFQRNILLGNTTWKQNTYLIVLNDDDRDGVIYAPRGDDLVIRVQAEGTRPRQVNILLRFASAGGSTPPRRGEAHRDETHTMTAVGQDQFRFTVPRLNESLNFWVRGGDARNDAVSVELLDRPKLTDAAVTVYPPAYTQEPPYQLRPGKSLIELLQGSEVEIRFTANKPLSRVVLLRDESKLGDVQPPAQPVEPAARGAGYVARFKPEQNATFTFRLADEENLTNVRPRQFLVRMVPDAAPTVSLKISTVSDLVTPQAILPLEMTFKDRYGLAGGQLIHRMNNESAEQGRIEIKEIYRGSKQLALTMSLPLSELNAQEDQQLVLHAQASDLNDVTGPSRGSSARYTLRIVSSEELLAELGRREQEYRQEFERLIDIQEKLRNDVLSAASVYQRGSATRQRAANFAALERRQRQIARQVGHLSTQYRRIYDELAINQLHSPQAQQRLVGGIVSPMDSLAGRSIAQVADHIDELGGDPSDTLFRRVDRAQEEILVEMRQILTNMSTWEGFHETITLLQTIIRMQKQLLEETDDNLNRQLDDIFKSD